MSQHLKTPLQKEDLESLQAGDRISIDGTLFTARDSAHKRIIDSLKDGEDPPIDLRGQIIYYVGPCPAKPGDPIGSAGPTTSARMDPYTLPLLKEGLLGMIGKGNRSPKIRNEISRFGAVYFVAMGGMGALLAKRVISSEVSAYKDLGPEAIRRLRVRNFPVVVGIDSQGNDIYVQGQRRYSR